MDEKQANRIGIANIEITTADTDTPWAIPKGCVWFTMQCRTAVNVRIGLEKDKAASSHPPYFTMKAGTSWDERNLDIRIKEGQSFYFAAGAACIVEIFLGICLEEEKEKK